MLWLAGPIWLMQTPSYDEIVRLAKYLASRTTSKDSVYVAASSSFNSDALLSARDVLPAKQRFDFTMSPVPRINSRDFFPIGQLAEADYVVTADPPLLHMARPEEQDLVSMVVEAFRDGWPVARSFEELPETFKINGSTVRVYHRTGHVPLSADVDMLERFKARFETPPGIQTESIPADAPFGARIAGEVGARVTVIGTHPTQRSSAPEATTLLHYDTIKAPMDLTVAALFVDSHCPGATAEVLAVPSSGGKASARNEREARAEQAPREVHAFCRCLGALAPGPATDQPRSEDRRNRILWGQSTGTGEGTDPLKAPPRGGSVVRGTWLCAGSMAVCPCLAPADDAQTRQTTSVPEVGRASSGPFTSQWEGRA